MTEIYNKLADSRENFIKYAYKFTKDKNVIDEVIQELYLYLCQCNKETLKRIYKLDGLKGLIGYGCIVIKRSLTSKKSKYYYKINKYYEKITSLEGSRNSTDRQRIREFLEQQPDEYPEEEKTYVKLELIDQALEELYWYDREIFKLYYYEVHTLDSLAAKTHISRNSLFNTIDKARQELKEIVKNETE
jgi:RNA polymerase sigma factor (sigma-70 family)